MQTLHEQIKEAISLGRLDEARSMVDAGLARHETDAQLHYLKGNLYLKAADWQQATNCFLRSIELDPSSPAAESLQMIQDIMNFYHKDLYNP